jgi:hypothetical protein
MAYGGHIRHGNPEFNGTDEPMLSLAESHGPFLCFGDPDPLAYGEQARGTALGGCI